MSQVSIRIEQIRNPLLLLRRAVPVVGAGLGLFALSLAGASVNSLLAAVVFSVSASCGVVWIARRQRAPLGWASQVTLARLTMVAALAAALLEPSLYVSAGWTLTGFALLTLALDGLDGWLARRLGESSAFGARFDMEVDAALIMVLAIALWLASDLGPWVLLVGLMRYGFVMAASVWPCLDAPLPPSFRRKAVCVWQVCALIVAMVPVAGLLVQQIVLLMALAGLVYSFALDVRWLWSQRLVDNAEQVMS